MVWLVRPFDTFSVIGAASVVFSVVPPRSGTTLNTSLLLSRYCSCPVSMTVRGRPRPFGPPAPFGPPGPPNLPPSPAKSRPATPARLRNRRRQILRDAYAEGIRCRQGCRRVVIVLREQRARDVRHWDIRHERRGRRVNLGRGNLVVRKCHAGGRVDELNRARREIARAHGRRGDGAVLILKLRGMVAGVVQLKVRPTVGVLVDAGNLERTADGSAEIVARKRQRTDWSHDAVSRLQVRGIERRSTEGVSSRTLIGTLPAPAAATERKPSGSATGTARTKPAAARPARSALRARPVEARSWWSEALRELARGRIEIAAVDGVEPIVERAAIDVDGIAAAADRHGIGLGALRCEA